jgi:hypothetical protein
MAGNEEFLYRYDALFVPIINREKAQPDESIMVWNK